MTKVVNDLDVSEKLEKSITPLEQSYSEDTSRVSSVSSPMQSASKPKKFSCKNYRIVCHCGAKNCRKFLF